MFLVARLVRLDVPTQISDELLDSLEGLGGGGPAPGDLGGVTSLVELAEFDFGKKINSTPLFICDTAAP